MADWDRGGGGLCDGVGNRGVVPLGFGCAVGLIRESTVGDGSSVVVWLVRVVAVAEVRIQTSE